jgi:hypothetical protein
VAQPVLAPAYSVMAERENDVLVGNAARQARRDLAQALADQVLAGVPALALALALDLGAGRHLQRTDQRDHHAGTSSSCPAVSQPGQPGQ